MVVETVPSYTFFVDMVTQKGSAYTGLNQSSVNGVKEDAFINVDTTREWSYYHI